MRAAIVLAAGGSRRFGRADKLLAPLRGSPLLLHALARAQESGVRRVYVVASSPHVRRLAGRAAGTVTVRAAGAASGLSASLAAGLRALRPIEREALIFLGDMPCASAPRRLRTPPHAEGVRAIWRGQPGHPMLVRVDAAKRAGVRGDRGLGASPAIAIVRGHRGNVLDIDSRAALRRARLDRAFGRGVERSHRRKSRCSKPPQDGSRPPPR